MGEEIEQRFEKYCSEHKITGKEKEKLNVGLQELIKKSKFEPGEALGIVTAQSLSEPATQLTMRAYHFAGAAGIRMASGLPRLIELFDLRKNIDNVIIVYLAENKKEKAAKLASQIVESTLKNVISTISYDFATTSVEIELEKKDLNKLELTPEDIEKAICKSVKKYKISRKGEKISADGVQTYSDFRVLKDKLLNIYIKGIKGAKETIILNLNGNFVIHVRGGNFKKILSIEGVDTTKTKTTNIEETGDVLGIEAARTALVSEVMNTLSQQGVYVDPRYIGLVGDLMCLNGKVESIGRYGIMKHKNSVLARLNFEETIKILFNAAVLNKKDNLNTLMSNLMIGQVSSTGTGTVKLKWNL